MERGLLGDFQPQGVGYGNSLLEEPVPYDLSGFKAISDVAQDYANQAYQSFLLPSRVVSGEFGIPSVNNPAFVGAGQQFAMDFGMLPALATAAVASPAANTLRMGMGDEPKPSLLMDEASRLSRAKQMGFDTGTPVYHGTTHNFKQFDPSKGQVEGWFGDSIYFSDSPSDVDVNYLDSGADITNRIERTAERIESEQDIPYEQAREIAEGQIKGEHKGAVIPAYLKMEKPLVLSGDKETFFDLDYEYDDFGDIVGENGLAFDLIDSIEGKAREYGFDSGQLINDLEIADYGGLPASEVDKRMRNSESLMYVENDEGDLISHKVIKEIFEDAGFDGIVMDASGTFTNMDIPSGTKHYIVFEPSQVRGKFADFDPEKKASGDYLSTVPAVPTGLLGEEKMSGDEMLRAGII